jgi:hypothetical protein
MWCDQLSLVHWFQVQKLSLFSILHLTLQQHFLPDKSDFIVDYRGFQAALVFFNLNCKAAENFIALKGGVYDKANPKIADMMPQRKFRLSFEAFPLAK